MILSPLDPWGPVVSLFGLTARQAGESFVFWGGVVVVLAGVIAAFGVIRRNLWRPLVMGMRDTRETVEFARSGDERMQRMETEMADLRAAMTRMADEMSQVPDLARAVASLAEKVSAEVLNAASVHDQLAERIEHLADRDEQLAATLAAVTTGEHLVVDPGSTPPDDHSGHG